MATKVKRIECPGCGQGWVIPVRVRKTGIHLFVCEECETTWFHAEEIGRPLPTNFMDYMQSQGLRGLWSEVERLE